MRLELSFWPYVLLIVLVLLAFVAAGAIRPSGLRGAVRVALLSLLAPAWVPGHGEVILVPAVQLLWLPGLPAKVLGLFWIFVFASIAAVLAWRCRRRRSKQG